MHTRYTTALRPRASRRLEEIGSADLLVGIPCYNNQTTIEHVLTSVAEGMKKHYPELRAAIVVSDGGSTDDTRDVARELAIPPYIEKIVQVYRGLPGKGSALRAVFEAASFLEVKACAVVDSDLRSITDDWVHHLMQPVIDGRAEFVAPLYTRHKYDGTITNNVVYNLTRALYGKRIRQPIGGDFGFSPRLAKHYATEGEWDSDVARFGIDIWMTLNAITQGVALCQSHLGTKVHDVKDPGESLGPMFRQVIYTLFLAVERDFEFWSQAGPSEPVPTYGDPRVMEAEPFEVDTGRMVRIYREGFEHFGAFWRQVVRDECFAALERLSRSGEADFYLPTEAWVKIVYDFAATFHAWGRHRRQLVDTMSPLYYARVASFVLRTTDMNNLQAEEVVEKQALEFEALKPYLFDAWRSRESEVGGATAGA